MVGPDLAPQADAIIGAADAHGEAPMQSLRWFLGSGGDRETEQEECQHLHLTSDRATSATA